VEALTAGHVLTFHRGVTNEPDHLAALARACFPDRAVIVEEAPDEWRVRVAPLAHLAAVYDAELSAVLERMGVALTEISEWHRIGQRGDVKWLESMNPAWALFAWAHWLAAEQPLGAMMIHVAIHEDLAVPALICGHEPTSFTELMDDVTIDLLSPPTVARAIRRGVIGVSGFITPLLRACPIDIVHITPAAFASDSVSVRFRLEETPWPPDPRITQPALELSRDGPCSYRRTTDPARISTSHESRQPVLLNIDLAAFDLLPGRRPPSDETLPRSVALTDLLEGLQPLASKISVVTIGYSPGWCPAQRWSGLVETTADGLEQLILKS
jgi:hypothetical protein